jgi:hypothetical protein
MSYKFVKLVYLEISFPKNLIMFPSVVMKL